MHSTVQPNSAVAMALRGVGGIMAPAGRCGRLSILMYHRVLPERDLLFPEVEDTRRFTWQMQTIANFFNVLPLSEAIARLRSNSLPPRALCVTFDDGYADNHDVALPILQRFGVSATFFIATGFLDGGRMWNDTVIEALRRAPGPILNLNEIGLQRYSIQNVELRRAAASQLITCLKYLPCEERQSRANEIADLIGVPLPDDLMMTRRTLRQLASAGMEIGGHTVNHPILARLNTKQAREEIEEGKRQVEEAIGQRIEVFAYPNGKPSQDYTGDHVDMVRQAGFTGAVSTTWGASGAGSDSYQLSRFTPWDASPSRFVMRLLQNVWRSRERAKWPTA